jgi:hypothetical protein
MRPRARARLPAAVRLRARRSRGQGQRTRPGPSRRAARLAGQGAGPERCRAGGAGSAAGRMEPRRHPSCHCAAIAAIRSRGTLCTQRAALASTSAGLRPPTTLGWGTDEDAGMGGGDVGGRGGSASPGARVPRRPHQACGPVAPPQMKAAHSGPRPPRSQIGDPGNPRSDRGGISMAKVSSMAGLSAPHLLPDAVAGAPRHGHVALVLPALARAGGRRGRGGARRLEAHEMEGGDAWWGAAHVPFCCQPFPQRCSRQEPTRARRMPKPEATASSVDPERGPCPSRPRTASP